MKRCPECDFIYENDQRFCDMDGRELSLAPRPILLTEGLVRKPPALLVKSQRRRLAVRVTAAMILGAVLFLAFYGSMHRIPAEEISYSSAKSTASTNAALNAAQERPAAVTEPVSTEQVSAPSVETADQLVREVRKAQSVSSPAKARNVAAPNRVTANPRPEMKADSKQENQKKESKLGSFFKKTGRFFKKPFGK
jgi:hypothetical protein